MEEILSGYGLNEPACDIQPFGTGLINSTWVVKNCNGSFILQKINDNVFKHPQTIAGNLSNIEAFLKKRNSNYLFVAPVKTLAGDTMVHIKGQGYYRLFPFVNGSKSFNVVETPELAYEAARQFGLFTKTLSEIDISDLQITLPSFHDLSLRYAQFGKALQEGNAERIRFAAALIGRLQKYTHIVEKYEQIKTDPDFKLRVTHHDTKISNVLFDKHGKGLCVIDLDTVMPGYFISDVGDMMRTYLCPVSEEEKDFDKISVREAYYKAIFEGYMAEMKDELSASEKKHFYFSGLFMIYMQALRFLTDYLEDDRYYGARYDGHNFVRAGNQATLLERLLEKETVLNF